MEAPSVNVRAHVVGEFIDDASSGESMDRLFVGQNGECPSWIQKSSHIRGGEPCIRDTVVSVSALVEQRKKGLPDQEILEAFEGLTPADLDAAWEYHAQNQEETQPVPRDESPS